jgi:hypothetical protein
MRGTESQGDLVMETSEIVRDVEDDIEEFGAVTKRIIEKMVHLYERGAIVEAAQLMVEMYGSLLQQYAVLQRAGEDITEGAKKRMREVVDKTISEAKKSSSAGRATRGGGAA